MKIGITLTSSISVDQEYIDLTRSVLSLLARNNFGVVYGGTEYGMMKELAESYKQAGGVELVGVMSRQLERATLNYKVSDKLDSSYWVETIGERISTIAELSDGILILPGGYGTLEEMGVYVGGKANKLFDKPIIIYNHNNFYDAFISFLEEMFSRGFSKIKLSDVVHIVTSEEDIVSYFNTYSKVSLPDKFV